MYDTFNKSDYSCMIVQLNAIIFDKSVAFYEALIAVIPVHVIGRNASLPMRSLRDQNYSNICIEEARHLLNSTAFGNNKMIHYYLHVENQAILDGQIRCLKRSTK